MIADLHCHYPMHLLVESEEGRLPAGVTASPNVTVDAMVKVSRRPGWLNKLRAAVLRVAAGMLNFRDDEWRVSLERLERGDVRAAFSVLYDPFAEIDLDELPGADPEAGYFGDLIEQIDRVESDLERIDPRGERHTIVRDATTLDRAVAERKVAFLHCVEGGFHLGGDVEEVDAHVAELARRGVVYITLAHLFWRGVATNAPALPFMNDAVYNRVFCQPRRHGLSKLGRAAVTAMHRHRVLIDVSHMNQNALDDTFALLEELDGDDDPRDFPVIASHAGYRFGEQAYMLSPETIGRIAARDGVIGLILARHQLNENAGVEDPESFASTVSTIRRHVDEIRRHTPAKTNAHVGIGSDLDGFIKPTVGGIEYADDLGKLDRPLREAYGADADGILAGNALRVVRRILSARA